MKKGLFITFEGMDGCGKSTQIDMLKNNLEEKGFEVILTREPGCVGLGTKIREILLNYDGDVSNVCESFLFLADRAQNVDCIIKPTIEAGKIVLCDRHTDSSLAYQGYGRQLDIERINMLNNIATSGLKPHLTIVFDIDVETSMKRVGKNKDRMESAGLDFHSRVRNGYLEIAKNEPQRVKVLDGTKSKEDIHKNVLNLIEAL